MMTKVRGRGLFINAFFIYFVTLENDKENDSRVGLTAQGVIQRRRRPKRRSTGVVHVDMEVICH